MPGFALYTNFIGDLDTSAEIYCTPNTYTGGDVGTKKVIPFDVPTSIGYKPQSDGTLLAQEDNAYYRAELTVILSSAHDGDRGPHYAYITFGGLTTTVFLTNAPVNFITSTVYINPNDIKKTNGILQLTVQSNYPIPSVNGRVRLFRLA